MKERLEQLTIGQFVDLLCGDDSILLEDGDKISEITLNLVKRNIAFEYREICDQAGVGRYLSQVEDLLKANLTLHILSMCETFLKCGAYDKAREVLVEFGVKADRMSDERLEIEIRSQAARARKDIAKSEQEVKAGEKADISGLRRSFDSQTASLMSHFKFQIDTSTMKATIYAHLVARFSEEVKAQRAALEKKR